MTPSAKAGDLTGAGLLHPHRQTTTVATYVILMTSSTSDACDCFTPKASHAPFHPTQNIQRLQPPTGGRANVGAAS
ncbi:Os02g0765950 [Oryza sativa Japonica Group]|uniref:Os02g0765950 protein n=1 Tax=Oryza sativa subsp. japonica TaxID=39947 RepID=A0A0P0VQ67_ORYSJ|nr:Os02g0765950 [Oryza sativa Japonica Group]